MPTNTTERESIYSKKEYKNEWVVECILKKLPASKVNAFDSLTTKFFNKYCVHLPV